MPGQSPLRTFLYRHPWVIPVLVALVVHAASLLGSFVYDDIPLIAKHPGLSSPGFLHAVWTRDYGFEYAGAARGLYRPLFMTAVYGLFQWIDTNAVVFHLFSLIFFCFATALVTHVAFVCAQRSVVPAMITGLVYGLHPARVETVSLITSLPDLIVEMCALGVVLCLVKETTPQSSLRRSAMCLGLSLVAALTKESAFFILPALALTSGLHGVIHTPDRKRALLPAMGVFLGLLLCLLPRYMAGIKSPVSLIAALARALGGESLSTLKTLALATYEIIVRVPSYSGVNLGALNPWPHPLS